VGQHGPIPKRSQERRRRNKTDSEGAPLEPDIVEVDEEPVTAPEPDENWHSYAIDFYLGCVDSVQAQFFEPSDWQALRMACEVQSRLLKDQPMKVADADGGERIEWVKMPVKGADLSALSKVWSSLMVTEGDRRRLRLEIQRAAATPDLPATAEQVTQDRAALFAIQGGA
jgi:hypothetical protein